MLNHPSLDGNKRIGHAALETFLIFNGYEICADVDIQESVILRVAAGEMTKEQFTEWVQSVIQPIDTWS